MNRWGGAGRISSSAMSTFARFAELAENAKHPHMLGFRRQAIFSPPAKHPFFPKVWGEAPCASAGVVARATPKGRREPPQNVSTHRT